ncbi:hypothetical protein BD410DRAFT_859818 [Rickenella mellea]|uniref:Uncharacterized protein n=1 Tax=Rickenella mellea TaxID=50990 RepID=A0A4Y7PHK4_9AGAM|nr:hypothetical protein BD410DRAFT_859818 [Rickenella mellea]
MHVKQRTIRSIVQQANLDHKDTWHHQDKELVGRCMRLARQRQPYLKRFYRDWATEEYIKVHLKNKRHYEKRRDKKKKAAGMVDEGVDDGDDDDDDGDDDDDTEESSEESGEGEESGGEELRAIADD